MLVCFIRSLFTFITVLVCFIRSLFTFINVLVCFIRRFFTSFTDSLTFAVAEKQCSLPQVCCHVASTLINEENVIFGLTNHYRLFLDEREVSRLVVSDEFHTQAHMTTEIETPLMRMTDDRCGLK